MSYGTPTNYLDLQRRGRLIIAFNVIASRYTKRVLEAMREAKMQPLPDSTHMQVGMVEMLKKVQTHYSIDTDMLERFDDDALCSELNAAVESIAPTGRFKPGYRLPEWVS